MIKLKAQIISKSATKIKDIARVVSVHESVINLQFNDGDFLCLHVNNAPLSPMGWVLKKQDFAQIKQIIKPEQYVEYDGIYIKHKAFSLQTSTKQINLKLTNTNLNRWQNLPAKLNVITSLHKKTGLYGSLSDALNNLEDEKFKPYLDFMAQILAKQKAIEFKHLLGKGLGLTPSSDDILIGILAVIFSSCASAQYLNCAKPFASYSAYDLAQHTTFVSANYVAQALNGNFATPLLHFLVQFNNRNKFFNNLRRLLNCGHTSGADTLFGICLALNYLNTKKVLDDF